MNRHLIWIIGGASVLGLGVPALAAARSAGTPEDNGVPGEVRGNCDEAEHAGDPDCLAIVGAGSPTITVTVPSTVPNTVTVPTTAATNDAANMPPAPTVPTTTIEDISGPCDELEHATDPQCTGVNGATGSDDDHDDIDDDHSGQSGHDDDGVDDDHSGRGHDGSADGVDDDDHSGPGGGDDRSGGSGHDGSDDNSGHGGGDD